jgi:Na+/H+-dicarboxylate symporter
MENGPRGKALPRQLWFQVLVAMVLGVALGRLVGPSAAEALGWMGTLFVQALNFVIVPLVLCSVMWGVSSIGTSRELGRLGAFTLAYYMLSSLAAVLVGQLLVNVIRPGRGLGFEGLATKDLPALAEPTGALDFALDLVLRFIPKNPVAALSNTEMLGIIGFSIFVGIAIAHAPGRSRTLARDAVKVGFDVMMVLTGFVIRIAPLGVLGLVTVAAADANAETIRALILYVTTIASGLLIHALVTLPLLLFLVGRIRPWRHYWAMRDAWLTAFSTSSSNATLPVTMRCVTEEVQVSERVTSFVVPMGATVNMDGTALYECVGVIFIAQVLGYPMDLGSQVIVVVTALAASIGAAGIPSAGLVMIFIVLDAVGIPAEVAGVIVGTMLAIDRPLDMMRTAVNVLSDSCGAAIIARLEGESLAPGLAIGSEGVASGDRGDS